MGIADLQLLYHASIFRAGDPKWRLCRVGDFLWVGLLLYYLLTGLLGVVVLECEMIVNTKYSLLTVKQLTA